MSVTRFAHNFAFSGPNRDVPVIISADPHSAFPSFGERIEDWHPATAEEEAAYEAYWNVSDDEQDFRAQLLRVGSEVNLVLAGDVIISRVAVSDTVHPYGYVHDGTEVFFGPDHINEVTGRRIITPGMREWEPLCDGPLNGVSEAIFDGSTLTYVTAEAGGTDRIVIEPR